MNRIMLLGALVAISPGFAHIVRVDFDHATRFSSYKTYSWVAAPGDQSSHAVFPNQLMERRITSFVDEALACRGLKRVPKGGDLQVSYRMIVTEQPQFITYMPAPGWAWDWSWAWSAWSGGIATTTVQPFYEGTLVVNIVDARRNKLVFQGTSTQAVSSRPRKNTEKLAKAVNRIMAKYPPQP
jgi:hypothetical protein